MTRKTGAGKTSNQAKNAATKKAPARKKATPNRKKAPKRKAPAAQAQAESTPQELWVRIRELEQDLADKSQQSEPEVLEDAEVAEQTAGIISTITELHHEIDVALDLKEALEADVAALKGKLAEAERLRVGLDARVKLLEAKAALADQLREDIAFIEEERNDVARRLEEASTLTAELTGERDGLIDLKAALEARIDELEGEKMNLGARVLNLEEAVSEMAGIRAEIDTERETSSELRESLREVKATLEEAVGERDALDRDLASTRETAQTQDARIGELQAELATAQAGARELRLQYEKQVAGNVELVDTGKRTERENRSLAARNETLKKELDAGKRALLDIRAAAARTSSRLRDRPSQ